MNELEKLKREFAEILNEYKQRYIRGNDNNTVDFKLSTCDIPIAPEQIVSEVENKMEYIKFSYIMNHGDKNEAEIDKLIKTCVKSFVEYQNEVGL